MIVNRSYWLIKKPPNFSVGISNSFPFIVIIIVKITCFTNKSSTSSLSSRLSSSSHDPLEVDPTLARRPSPAYALLLYLMSSRVWHKQKSLFTSNKIRIKRVILWWCLFSFIWFGGFTFLSSDFVFQCFTKNQTKNNEKLNSQWNENHYGKL